MGVVNTAGDVAMGIDTLKMEMLIYFFGNFVKHVHLSF